MVIDFDLIYLKRKCSVKEIKVWNELYCLLDDKISKSFIEACIVQSCLTTMPIDAPAFSSDGQWQLTDITVDIHGYLSINVQC